MRRATALAVAVAFAALAACTPNTDPPTKAAGVEGGTLRVGITRPGSLDPHNAYEASALLVTSLLCEPLLTIDPATGEVRPGLATHWVVSDGGKRITLRLRKARFTDGRKVTSDDVIASLSRAASEGFAGHTASLLEPIDGFAEISGRADDARQRDRQELRGLGAIDGASLSIQLSRADADFVRVLAHPVAAPMPAGHGHDDPPVCAGPYKLDTADDARIRLVRNERYHGRHPVYTNGGKGYADAVEFVVDAPPETVDVAPVPHGYQGAEERPNGYLDYVGLPLGETSPFKDPRTRLALAAGLDRSRIVEGRQPATGFQPDTQCAWPAPPPADDVQLGKVELPLYYDPAFETNAELAGNVAAQWREKLGLTLIPTPKPFEDLAKQAAQPGGVDGAFHMGWQPPVPRPDAYLGPPFTSQGIGTDNLTRFSDPDFERILDRDARSAEDDEDSALGYDAAEERLCEALPMIPVAKGQSRWRIDDSRVESAGQATLDAGRGQPVLRELYVREGSGQ